jgi:Domain of unknown function (DUF222)
MSQAPHPGSPGDDDGHDAAPGPGSDGPHGRDGRAAGASGSGIEAGSGAGEQFGTGMPLETAAAGSGLADALGRTRVSLGGLSDDALAGFLGGCQKIAAWAGGMLLEGIAEYAGRRPDDRTARRAACSAAAAKKARAALAAGEPVDPPPYDEFAPDELMPVLRLSKGSAGRQVELALALRYRLRATLAAMLAGQIDAVRARIIAEATADLTPAQAAKVEAKVLPDAGRQTYIALGISLGKAVLKVDPEAAIRRRKKAEKRARVERWREYDGTGALAGRNLPPDDTLAADQALTALALELRDAGLDGPLDYLRATALIDRIIGRDSRPEDSRPEDSRPEDSRPEDSRPEDSRPEDSPRDEDDPEEDWEDRDEWPARDQYLLDEQDNAASATPDHDRQDGDKPDGDKPDRDGPDRDGPDHGGPDGNGPESGGRDGGSGGTRPPARPGGRGGGGKRRGRKKRIAARINLTLAVKTLLDLGDTPGDAGPFGPLDPAAARDFARTAAAHPGTRWCLTLTDEDGRAVAHGCARGPRPWAGLSPRDGPGVRDGPQGSSPGSSPDPRKLIGQFLARLGIIPDPIAVTCCDHRDAEPGYTPSRKLRHKIHARTPTCSYWGCRRPAQQCDDDHTVAWDSGGLSCECNLAPLCRRHHRMKQREGWTLTQPEPGIMIWEAPSRRRYVTTPARYAS